MDMALSDPTAKTPSVSEAFDVVLKPDAGGLADGLIEIRIDENLFAIGRLESPFDRSPPEAVAQLSRRHARIFIEHGRVYIADLGSKNGTAVNGVAVRDTPLRLEQDDEVSFGSRLSYRVQFTPRKRRLSQPKEICISLVPQRDDLGLHAIEIVQFPYLVSKSDETFARYRDAYPHQVNYVSRRHAHVFIKGGSPYVEDLGSTNGTFVNDERIGESAVELKDGDKIAFGGSHFAYKVSLHGGESESTLTEMAGSAQAQDESDSEKTTFVGSAHSFLDIFCVDQIAKDEDEVNHDARPATAQEAEPKQRHARRGKFMLFLAEFRSVLSADDPRAARRVRIMLGFVLFLLVAVASAIFLTGSPERDARALMSGSSYSKAATVSNAYLRTHPQDARFMAMNTEAVLKSNIPSWLAAMQKGDYARADTVIAQMKALSENNPEVRSMLDELEWVGKLERFVMTRGTDAPVRMYQDEARIGEILRHWEADASGHQRDLDRIAGYIPEFREPFALALSHLRKLQSDDSVYLAAIERLNAGVVKSLSSDDLDSISALVKDYADKYPRLSGLDRVRTDIETYAKLRRDMNGASLAPLAASIKEVRFNTPPFQDAYRRLSASQLPSAEVLEQYATIDNAWSSGRTAQAIDGLQGLQQGPWSSIVQKELAHKKAVAARYSDLQKTRGTKGYEDALLAFYEALDLASDAYFVKQVMPELVALKDRATARAQSLMTQAQTLWTQYRTNGGIGGSQRLESGVSDTFRSQARLLSEAADASTRGMRILRQLKADNTKWAALSREIDDEAELQKRSLQDLRMVLEPASLKTKLTLIGGGREQ